MNSQEQFELRIGVFHHPTLKIEQLCSFLNSQCDDFLKSELPQSLMVRQLFTSCFEPIQDHKNADFNEYVGVIVLYSSSSGQTYSFAKHSLELTENMQNTFRILVEMDNSQKHMNIVGGDGQMLAMKHGLLFIRLNLYNSDELVNNLNRSIYLMVENYYYPNDDQKHNKEVVNFEIQADPHDFQLNYDDKHQKIIAQDQHHKEKVLEMIEQAALIRTSRQKQIIVEQQAIDQSIQNVEKVLNNINRHIKVKFDSDWFSQLKDTLYKPVQKESKIYNKIKLTQEFIEEEKEKRSKLPLFKSRHFKQSIHNSKYNYELQKTFKKLDSSLIKIVIVTNTVQSQTAQIAIELEVYQNSKYEELASNALRKLGMRQTDHNMRLMVEQIKGKVELYLRQLCRKVAHLQRQRTFQRSYLAVNKK